MICRINRIKKTLISRSYNLNRSIYTRGMRVGYNLQSDLSRESTQTILQAPEPLCSFLRALQALGTLSNVIVEEKNLLVIGLNVNWSTEEPKILAALQTAYGFESVRKAH